MLLSTAAKRAPSLIPPRATRPLSTLSTALQRDAPLDLHPEVQEALATNKPVVALETAVVTHGFPYPDNIKLATSLETIVRSTGAVPATVGVIRGRIKIGLHEKELARLADKDTHAAKVSRRDIAPAISLKADGGTTCSATLIFAALAGIKVFATGGLGGVHRGGENTMDVSADLNELTRCPVGLVSAGVKSILDIGRTLEYLETLGVPVITYGTTREFPAFFSRRSGFNAPWNINDPVTAARILHTQWQLGLNNGALIAVPISPEFEEAGMFIQKAVDQAVAESEANGVSRLGKEATPWLLARVGELTQGASRESNVALLQNTALVGGHIAVEYQKLLADLPASPHYAIPSTPNVETEVSLPPADLLVVGSAAVDITAKAKAESDKSLAVHSTAPGSVSLSLGGVARNIAEASHRLISARSRPSSCMLVSPIGDDAFGRLLVEETAQLGMRVDGFIKSDRRTAVCNMVLDSDGGLIGGIADMDITAALDGHSVESNQALPKNALLIAQQIISHIDTQKPRIVAMDGNLSPETIKNVAGHCIRNSIKVFFEPTSVIKSTVIFPAIAASLDVVSDQAPIAFTSPNILELARMLSSAEALDLTSHPAWWRVVDSLSLGPAFRMDLERLAGMNASEEDSSKGTLAFLVDEGIAQMAIKLLPFFQHLVIKCGQAGVVLVMRIPEVQTSQWAAKHSQPAQRYIIARGKSNEAVILCHFPPHRIGKLVNVTGAGDSFVGVLLANLLQFPDACHNPAKLSDVIFAAQSAAILTLQSPHAVSPMLSSI